jgi:Putative Ig domain
VTQTHLRAPERARTLTRIFFFGLAACAATVATASVTISGSPPNTVTVGSAYSFTPTATDSAGRKVTFSIVGKPSWATFSGTTGKLSGTPSAANVGTYGGIGIEAYDGVNGAMKWFGITVKAASGTPVVKISGTPATSATVGSAYKFQPSATDSAGKTLSFSVSNKPSWATFSIASGLLSGTPTSAQAGTYSNILISASDGIAKSALPAFAIKVSAQTTTASTLAGKYPGDIGIGSDSAVVLYENFEEGSVATVVSRYDSHTNSPGMALVTDHPTNGPGSHAMQLTSGGANSATDLYKSFGPGYDELYFRYYVKYPTSGPYHHSGLWIGGYNPPLPYPYPRAGTKPVGNDRYSIGLEPDSDFTNSPMDFYTYWRGMHSWKSSPTGAVGDYYGDTLLHDAEFQPDTGIWQCFEVHLKLNPDPTTAAGAVLEVWHNDTLIRRFDNTGPSGYWVKDKFCPHDADGSECTAYRPANPTLVPLDQQWRTTSALKINYFWPQNYNDTSTKSSMLLDDMVVAKQRIGCTVKP